MQSNDDIFTNQKEVVENIKESAANLGIDTKKVVPDEKPKQQLMAKKNCKTCYGRGVLTIAGFDVAVRTKEKNVSIHSDSTKKPNGKFAKSEGRNSSKKEPVEKVKALMYCNCVRPVNVKASSVGAT